MAAGDLTTLAEVRAYLANSIAVSNDENALLESLITSVSKTFANEAQHPILTQSYTDTFDGSGGVDRMLKMCPGVVIADPGGVFVDGVEVPERPDATSSGWVLTDTDAGMVRLVGYTFSSGVANCSITYTAGYGATAPADVAFACTDQVAYMYRAREHIGITNESIGGKSVTYAGGWKAQYGDDGLTPLFISTAARYRRVA